MKTMLRGIIVTAVLLALAAPVFAGGAQEVDFLAEFEEALRSEGVSEEEAQAVAEAARQHDWTEADAADPAVIAEAVAKVEKEGTDLTPEEIATLAHELGKNAEELEKEEGYTRSEVAQATLQAVEQMQEQIRTWHDGDQEEPLGETVRNTVSETARKAARERNTGSDEGGEDDRPEQSEEKAEAGKAAGAAASNR
jgi:hypothetical protein